MPLTAIRAFVAIGVHGNFTRAAAALGITQSAVSRNVATLEALAGCQLFERKGSAIAFTPIGLQFYNEVGDAVSTIELATHHLVQQGRVHDRLLVRTSMPTFALAVVVPALGAFTAIDNVNVDLVTSLSPPQPSDQFDVLITRDLTLPGTESWNLIHEELVCVGSPALVRSRTQAPYSWPMIAARSRPDVIATWAMAKGIAPDQLYVGAMYDHFFLAVAAAIGGAGLLVVPRLFVLDQLHGGTLVMVEGEKVVSGAMYAAYLNPHSNHVQTAREFCRWLKKMLRDRIQSADNSVLTVR
ncbi:MAG: LysR family transcriptional regulator [Burkholderiaceae bacterium]|nr:LysR family transcriptional regulator [Burkholderiaceae bacterium]